MMASHQSNGNAIYAIHIHGLLVRNSSNSRLQLHNQFLFAMYASQQTVEFAEQLLVVVKALAVNPSANGEANSLRPLTPLEAYQAQGKAEDLCTKVLQSVLGPSAYTLLIAGA